MKEYRREMILRPYEAYLAAHNLPKSKDPVEHMRRAVEFYATWKPKEHPDLEDLRISIDREESAI